MFTVHTLNCSLNVYIKYLMASEIQHCDTMSDTMSRDKGDTVIEMSGAGSASLLRVLAEAGTDLLLRLNVRIIVSRRLENSDAHTSKATETQMFVIDGWSRINPSDVNHLIEGGDISGLLRFRSNHQHLLPSYQDRRIMRRLRTRNETSIFILVNNESTDCLGIKSRMTGFLITQNTSGLGSPVKIKVPCLGTKSDYIQSKPSSGVRKSLVQGMREDGNIGTEGVIKAFEKVSENFHKNMDVVIKEVLELEGERDALKKKILQMKNTIQIKKSLTEKNKMFDFDIIAQKVLDKVLSDTATADVNLNNIYMTEGGVLSEDEGVRDDKHKEE